MSEGRQPSSPFRLIVLMPVFEDWQVARLVCERLDKELARLPGVESTVLLVDDGSPSGLLGWSPFTPATLRRLEALRLRRNLGHQRAIATGLCHIHDHRTCDAVVVMDADGEDRPEDAVRLVEHLLSSPEQIVFAQRRRRTEGPVFRLGYLWYRVLHRCLTGVSVQVGNFSVVPCAALSRLVTMAELWNHYAGAVFRSKLPHTQVPLDRGPRLGGRSQMGGLVPLVMHGIGGIATFHDVVATRILLASVGTMVLLAIALGAVLAIRFGTDRAVPGWATYTVGLLLVLSVQLGSTAFGLVLSLISNRLAATVVPARDYGVFVAGTDTLWSPPDGG
jgi:polyisoprenyl-phosphate glycosyltransferase